MSLVDYTYYTGTYHGNLVPNVETFLPYDAQAERALDAYTRGAVTNAASLTSANLTALENAICAQCDYYAIVGPSVAITGLDSSSFTVGNVHIEGSRLHAGATMICPQAKAILEQTGLLNRDVAAPDWPDMPWPWRW